MGTIKTTEIFNEIENAPAIDSDFDFEIPLDTERSRLSVHVFVKDQDAVVTFLQKVPQKADPTAFDLFVIANKTATTIVKDTWHTDTDEDLQVGNLVVRVTTANPAPSEIRVIAKTLSHS